VQEQALDAAVAEAERKRQEDAHNNACMFE
jgi:hypothetical protein